MINKKIHILIAITCILISAPSCDNSKKSVVAEVNGRPIYVVDVANVVKQESNKYDATLVSTDESMKRLTQTALEVLIQEALLLDEAKRKKITVTDRDVDAELTSHFGTAKRGQIKDILKKHGLDSDFWLRAQKNKLIIRKLVEQEVISTIPVSNEEIKTYFRKNKDQFGHGKQYRARQILTDSKERAAEIKKKLDRGADFAELAKKYSLSPDSERGGDLGFFSTKDFPPAFTEIVAQLDINEISGVKKTDYGYQIFQLLGTRPPRTLTIDEVRPQIIDRIRHNRSSQVFGGWFDGLRARGSIIVHDEALKEVPTHAQSKK